MIHKFKYSMILLSRGLVFLLCSGIFFLAYGKSFSFMLLPSRTSGVTLLAFFIVYVLMTRVYGGFDIGTRKSRPILYSFILTLFVTDLFAHLFLCIMNTTVVHGGVFVYEQPLKLMIVYLLQLLSVTVMAHLCNGLYFRWNPPARCLIITPHSGSAEDLIQKIQRLKRQFQVCNVSDNMNPRLLDLIDAHDTVFFYNLAVSERTMLVDYCYQQKKEVYYNVELSDVVSLGSERVLFDDKTMIHYAVKGLTFEQRVVKRAMDLAIASVGLIIASPIMLATALAIKLEDGGPVFYRQKRATYAGRTFDVIKFRSMRVESGEDHRSAIKDDDRITKVGHIIRKFRIDELPQIFNILKSDMSIVGPRPEMLENVDKYTAELPEFAYRLRAKAGLTGMAQIYGKYNTSPKDKLVLDLTYIERYSILLDIKLIMRTVLVLLTPDESTEAFEQAEKAAKKEAERV